MDGRRPLGIAGEDVAAGVLRRRGFAIVDRNWRCRDGELDVVARRGGLVVFCEVKARRTRSFGEPFEAVDARKQARLRRLAARWLAEHRARASEVRFDVVSIVFTEGGPQVVHLENAF